MEETDGLTVISPERVSRFFGGFRSTRWGRRTVTGRKLRARGIERLVDVRAIDDPVLRETVGGMADWLRQLAHGIDDRQSYRTAT